MESRKEKAERLFREGFNCSQSVFAAYADCFGMEEETALKLSSSFGGGIGRMRETCGTACAMFLLAGLATGSATPGDREGRIRNYTMVQQMAKAFQEKTGSLSCRELLGLSPEEVVISPVPEERTADFYEKRPCLRLILEAAGLIEDFLFPKGTVTVTPVVGETALTRLAQLADEVWHEYFPCILTPDQIDYMVEKFQSLDAFHRQMSEEDYTYYFIRDGVEEVGYTGVAPKEGKLFLSKLYVKKEFRGKGYSSKALAFLDDLAREEGYPSMWLTVNKYNDHSIAVYKKKGFVTIRSQVTDIGKGYVMDDYVMERQIPEKG